MGLMPTLLSVGMDLLDHRLLFFEPLLSELCLLHTTKGDSFKLRSVHHPILTQWPSHAVPKMSILRQNRTKYGCAFQPLVGFTVCHLPLRSKKVPPGKNVLQGRHAQ